MAAAPDRIRDDIQTTRSELIRDVDALADRTLPNRVVRRRWTQVKERMRSMSDRVMGAADSSGHGVTDRARQLAHNVGEATTHAGERAGELATEVTDTVRHTPQMISRQTRGNPVAAGVIAFGVGLLASSLMPATELERRAGQQLRENADDLLEPLAEPAQHLRDDVTTSLGEAADEVKATAKRAVHETTEQARTSADQARASM
jgi:hypothetical protein